MKNKVVLSQKFWSEWVATNRFCCNKPCPCSKKNRNDKLFTKAKTKLNREIDLLEVVKTLRATKLLL